MRYILIDANSPGMEGIDQLTNQDVVAFLPECPIPDDPAQEISIITQDKNFTIPGNLKNPVRIYPSILRCIRKTRFQECNRILDSLDLDDTQKKQVIFWIKRAHCIRNCGKRKYKTHNRLQNILQNQEQLAKIYQAVKDLL